MKRFLDEDFLLDSPTAVRLYEEHARDLPIIDYHNHLPPDEIAADRRFENLTQAWLQGDHYKWRAMRANGVSEHFITGGASDREKFRKWAETVPYTVRNPLYQWTHLELKRYFGIDELLGPESADRIYDRASEMLRTPDYSVRRLLEKMRVEVLCTTDDPADDLRHHRSIREEGWRIPVLPAFRADKVLQVDDTVSFNAYLERLAASAGTGISSYNDLLEVLRKRHGFFMANGCGVSDHGLERVWADDFTESQVATVFARLRAGEEVTEEHKRKFRSALLHTLAEWDWEHGFVQQFHLGAMRNNNSRMMASLGPDTGWDSIGDFPQAVSLSRFLDRLDAKDRLAKTVLYNLNPADNALMATMIGNFNDGSVAGKIQWGSGWWFLDQKRGMEDQLNTLSEMGLLSRFIGMLTDSRSFLSFTRHEYFRRLLCNLFGRDIENGELPNDVPWMGRIIEGICHRNAADYFGWSRP
jgi:glucuronate isomerase